MPRFRSDKNLERFEQDVAAVQRAEVDVKPARLFARPRAVGDVAGPHAGEPQRCRGMFAALHLTLKKNVRLAEAADRPGSGGVSDEGRAKDGLAAGHPAAGDAPFDIIVGIDPRVGADGRRGPEIIGAIGDEDGAVRPVPGARSRRRRRAKKRGRQNGDC